MYMYIVKLKDICLESEPIIKKRFIINYHLWTYTLFISTKQAKSEVVFSLRPYLQNLHTTTLNPCQWKIIEQLILIYTSQYSYYLMYDSVIFTIKKHYEAHEKITNNISSCSKWINCPNI